MRGRTTYQERISKRLTASLPAYFTEPPINGTLSYTVTDVPCGSQTCKKVQFNTHWEPEP